MIEIVPATAHETIESMIALATEYVTWMLAEVRVQYPQLDTTEFASERSYDDIRKKFPGEHVAPFGGLFIATNEGEVCGCIALGKLTDDIGEVRTLYVRPACRGLGVGKLLVDTILREARRIGYSKVRLDTLAFMTDALKLYRGMGFRDIPSYRDSMASLPQYVCFLELTL